MSSQAHSWQIQHYLPGHFHLELIFPIKTKYLALKEMEEHGKAK